MEPLAAKTVIVNLANEHQLVMDSMTTDRSSDLRVMMRYGLDVKIFFQILNN